MSKSLLLNNKSVIDPSYYKQKCKAEKKIGRKLSAAEFEKKFYTKNTSAVGTLSDTGTSVFDPVLTETMLLWFSTSGDRVIDPFAGGSVRGIVSTELGREYFGVDLRQEQIDANIEQAEKICDHLLPEWICADSKNIDKIAEGEFDFILTCPPYGSLEKYSDSEADLSNMSDEDFDETYCEIVRKTASLLKNDRFGCFVVGNYRDKKGYLRDLVGLTVRAMESAGCKYYNDIIFATPAGTLPTRAGRYFKAGRKVGKIHQYVLIFCKGDWKKATERLGDVEIPDMEQYVEEDE